MRIRKAEPRDISAIGGMLHQLLKHLEACGQWLYARDRAKFDNGVMGFVIAKILHEDSLVLVDVDDRDDAVSFLIGGLKQFEAFFEHDLVGEVQWVYPLNLKSRQLVREFEKWARGRGATAGSNYHTPGNELAGQAMRHHGLQVAWHYWVKPYDAGKEVENVIVNGSV